MNIILDNIIFSLQRSGGISTLWGELIEKTKKNTTYFLEYKNKEINIVRKKLNIQESKILNKKNNFIQIKRFLPPKLNNFREKFIFSSSYYRVSSNKNAINVTVVHDFTHEHFHRGIRKFIHTRQKRNAIRKSQGVICISENTKKDLLHFFPKTNESKIKVIYNGVGDHFYKIENVFSWTEIGQQYHFLEQKKSIIFIGHRFGYKNFDCAVLAFSLLPKSYHLIIVGEKLSKKEDKFINKNLKKESYSVLSGIDNIMLNKIYNKSFVLLYPSSYEGFGIPVLEAMKAGLPTIALRSSSIPEVAGDAGILIDELDAEIIKDKIIELEDSNYYQKISKKGLVQVKKFSWRQTMEEYLDFYQELYDKK